MSQTATTDSASRNKSAAFAGGGLIGALGGLIGLGGAEFRLPLLIGMFRFAAIEAVILNKAMRLVVVATALPFRTGTVPFSAIAANWPVVINLLAGSLIGAWFGAGWATRLESETLYKVIAILLVAIAVVVLLFGLGSGLASIVGGTLPLELFGREGYGARLGLVTAARQFSSALAPFIFALAEARAGIAPALWSTAAVACLAITAFAAIVMINRQDTAPLLVARDSR